MSNVQSQFFLKNFIFFIFFALLIALGVKFFLIEVFTVPTDSMLPSIPVGKKVMVLKFFFRLEKNNIVAFEKDHENFVKRLKGLPHDSVYFNISDRTFSLSKYEAPALFIIPKKNDTVTFTRNNLPFYQKLIEKSENTVVAELGDKIFVDGIETNQYIFKHNYYFLQGDNTVTSIDSRSFGLIPDNSIFGKIILL